MLKSVKVRSHGATSRRDMLLGHSGGHWGGGRRGRKPPPIIFTEALVLKSGNTRKFLFQEVEPLLIFSTLFRSFI